MQPWADPDLELAARIKEMVVAAMESTPSPSPTVALEVTRQVLQFADRLIESFETVNPLPRPLACQPGCSYCCHNQVELTPPEAFLLGQMITQFYSPEKQDSIREKTARMAALKAGKSPPELAAGRLARPCPLLEADRCGIYPWRPLMCRAMHALDAEHCRRTLLAGDLAADDCYLHRYVFTFSIAHGLTEGFKTLGCRPGTLELTQALRDVLQEPDLLRRWLRGKDVFGATSPSPPLE
jgi:Fe-S-cluster containining protein